MIKFWSSQYQHRVLCVDNDELSLLMNATILRNEGYEVIACADPLRAASIAESEELDLAILDYQMPVMNGAELAVFCKVANPAIKVIIFSGSLAIPSSELLVADSFVQKGSGLPVLLNAVESLLKENARKKESVFKMQANDS
jgi:CheY-like chemotaxis protein